MPVKTAQNLLSKHWVDGKLPIDPQRIAEQEGLQVKRNLTVDEISGELVPNGDSAIILYNSQHSAK